MDHRRAGQQVALAVGASLPRRGLGARPLGAAPVVALVAAGLAGLWGLGALSGSGARSGAAAPAAGLEERAQLAYAKLPLAFERNRGQSDPRVKFLSRGAGYTLFLTPREAVLSLQGGTPATRTPAEDGRRAVAKGAVTAEGAVVRMRMVGASPRPRVTGLSELPGKSNYMVGRDRRRWRTGIESYAKVRYEQVWPGIDVLYYGRRGRLEYDFVLRPGADPGRIALDFAGARRLRIDRRGDLLLKTAAGTVRQRRPRLYQRAGATRRPVSGSYVLEGGGRVRLRVGAYDRTRPLVIDPVLAYSTYLGGAELDGGWDIAVDSAGSAYVTGSTGSADFPTTAGAFDRSCGTDGACDKGTTQPKADAFVAKLRPDGSGMVYSTYLGGGGDDPAAGIAVDGSGQAYLTGTTKSTDFPTTANAYQKDNPPDGDERRDAFVTKLAADGSRLAYSTYLGSGAGDSGDNDRGAGLAVDSAGGAYVAGTTNSSSFPTRNAFQPARPPGQPRSFPDAFFAKLDTTRSGDASLVYSTYLGGENGEGATGVAVSAGQAYVVGLTYSSSFPTKNAFQPLNASSDVCSGVTCADGFVAKLDPSAAGPGSLAYSTYFGGTREDHIFGVAVEAPGKAYLAGRTDSANLPTRRPLQSALAGGSDGFVAKLDVTGRPDYSTYLGGNDFDVGNGIAVDGSGSAYVVGTTTSVANSSGTGGFPTKEAIQTAARGGADAFLTKLDPEGSTLAYSTYLGGSGSEDARGVALDSASNAYLTGSTDSTDFPTEAPLQPANAGRNDAFVARISPGSSVPFPEISEVEPTAGPTAGGAAVTIRGTNLAGASAVRFGDSPAASFTQDSPTQITAVSPPRAAGLVDISVTTAAGATGVHPDTKFYFGDSPWYRTGSLDEDRSRHTATLANGKLLVVGGGVQAGIKDSAQLYDPRTGKWTPTGKLSFPRALHTATLLTGGACGQPSPPGWCGKVLVVGGLDRDGAPVAQAELYDPSSGQWSAIGGPQTARARHSATLLGDGRVLVAGGCSTAATCGESPASAVIPWTAVRSAEIYDAASNTWRATQSPQYARNHHTATRLANGRVLLVGGFAGLTGGTLAESIMVPSEVYDPATDSWTPTRERDDEATRRVWHTATLLEDGRVLVAGGMQAAIGSARRSAELYDPARDEWRSTGLLNRARDLHSATLLPSGKVLVAGGGPAPASAEIFDPKATVGNTVGTWAQEASMLFGRSSHSAILLSSDPTTFKADASVCGQNCGKVLVLGGGTLDGQVRATELYTPRAAATPPPGTSPPGTSPPGTSPPGTSPPGTSPPGTSPPGTSPPGTSPPGTSPPGGDVPGTFPPGTRVPSPFPGCPRLSANVIRGTVRGERIKGTPRGDRIFAGTGEDVVDALAGDDCVDLGTGADRGQGGLGADLILGGLGADRIAGGSGNDRLRGGGGNDRINAGRGNDRASGDQGNDLIRGSFGNDRLHGVSGNDRLFGSRGRDRINGGSSNDVISAGSSGDRVAGDQGSDRINGNSGDDVLRGNSGHDRITGSTGFDRIAGGSGNDRINARDGRRDRVDCGRGRDRVVADRFDVVARNCERVVRRS